MTHHTSEYRFIYKVIRNIMFIFVSEHQTRKYWEKIYLPSALQQIVPCLFFIQCGSVKDDLELIAPSDYLTFGLMGLMGGGGEKKFFSN